MNTSLYARRPHPCGRRSLHTPSPSNPRILWQGLGMERLVSWHGQHERRELYASAMENYSHSEMKYIANTFACIQSTRISHHPFNAALTTPRKNHSTFENYFQEHDHRSIACVDSMSNIPSELRSTTANWTRRNHGVTVDRMDAVAERTRTYSQRVTE